MSCYEKEEENNTTSLGELLRIQLGFINLSIKIKRVDYEDREYLNRYLNSLFIGAERLKITRNKSVYKVKAYVNKKVIPKVLEGICEHYLDTKVDINPDTKVWKIKCKHPH